MVKMVFILQLGLSLLFFGIIYLIAGKLEAISFLSGAFYASLNLLFIVFIVSRLFRKKSVALTFILIIFKYTIFGLALYYLVTSNLLTVSWFVVGLSILLPSILGLAISYWKQLEKDK